VLKTAGDPTSVAGAVRAELRNLDPALPVTGLKTMEEHLGFADWGAEFGAGLLSSFAMLGWALNSAWGCTACSRSWRIAAFPKSGYGWRWGLLQIGLSSCYDEPDNL
jgi:hypothetical protein